MQNFIKTILNMVQNWTKKEIRKSTADWNQNDPGANNYVKNRTHWEEHNEIVLVDNFTLDDAIAGINMPRYTFVVGDKYDVIWNGVSYPSLECYFNDEYRHLGNPEELPFYIDDDGGNGCFIQGLDDSSWIVSIIYHENIVHKLDPKYIDLPDLPENIATTDDVQNALDAVNGKMNATDPVGSGSFSMGRKADTTVGNVSFALGYNTTASASYSYAEGHSTIASGIGAHAEGVFTTASGSASHSEGQKTIASGSFSHAEGNNTKATGRNQHAQGQWNIEDTSETYAHIVGNGSSDTARSNAHTLDWFGNAWYAGDVYVGSTSGTNKDEGSKKLATEEYVDAAVPTDDHINDLINTALGVIENGTY